MKTSLLVAAAAACVLAVAPAPRAFAQAPAATSDTLSMSKVPVRAIRLTAPVVIDGMLDEAVWSSGPAITNFTQRDPDEGAASSQRTEVRLAYDDDALYIGARLYDTAPDSILARLSRRDGFVPGDQFALFLDPLHDRRSGYYFMLSAAGTQFDGTLLNDSWDDDSWDGVWQGKAHVDSLGWTAEMRIPYTQLRFASQDKSCLWGVNFKRVLQRRNESSYVVYQPKRGSGFVSRFPDLVGIEHISSGRAIELSPYVTGKAGFLRHAAGDPFNDGKELKPNGGLDLRTSLGSKLTMVATVNPDFGQVEVDPAVVNLSDVETFYPEKRPFFVEGSANFGYGQQGANDYWGFNWPEPTFFYSRRIGRAPTGSLPAADYADVPNGTTILGAAKITGKISPSWNFGTMHAVTRRMDANLSGNPGGLDRATVEPATYFGVARFQKEFPQGKQGLGFMVNETTRDLGPDGLKDQFNSNSLMAGFDGWWFLDDKKNWVVSGWTAGTQVRGTADRITDVQQSSRHYFQRPDADHLRFDPTRTSLTGVGSRYWLNHQNGDLILNAAAGFISPDFENNDIGFLSRADVINMHIGGGWKWTKPTKHRKYLDVTTALYSSWDFDGNRTSTGLWTQGSTEFSNNYSWNYHVAYSPQTTSVRRTRGGPRTINFPAVDLGMYFDTDGKSRLFYFIDSGANFQPGAHSQSWYAYPGIEFKPAPNVTLRLGPGYEQHVDYAQYVGTNPNPGNSDTYGADYVFAELEQRQISANIRLNWAFTPSVSLQFYGQPLIAIGQYSNYKSLARPNSFEFNPYPITNGRDNFNVTSLIGNAVLRWEYRPGSAFYLVWSHDRYDDSPVGDNFDFPGSRSRLFKLNADNIFLAKFTYYFNL
ncbi:MAG: DUF5916 domain-containing protein [Candidatus Eisenbacteria bacterium]